MFFYYYITKYVNFWIELRLFLCPCVCVCVYVSLLMESQPQSWVRLMKVKTMKPYTYICRNPESKSNETERNSS